MFTNTQLINEMNKLNRFALRLTRNSTDADDLLQSTILRAYEKRHLFQEDGNVFAWTSKIMYNLFVSNYRRRVKFESQYDPEPYLDTMTQPESQFDKIALQEVGEAMKQLSNEQRDVLIMVTVQGMKYEQVAEKLDIPVGTVRSRLSRARNTLAMLMEGNNSSKSGYSVQMNKNMRASSQAA